MKKMLFVRLCCFITFMLFKLTLEAQLIYDTINNSIVGPGTQLIEINEITNPWSIKILEVDLCNPYINIETVKANDKLEGLEKTSSMALRKTISGHNIIGAVNGDFFSGTGIPINIQVANGEIIRTPISKSTITFNLENTPSIQILAYSGKITCNKNSYAINEINGIRNTDQLVLYNKFIGESTNTNPYGTELICTPLSEWYVNDTVWCIANSLHTNTGNTTFPHESIVLSGHGLAASYLTNNIILGDSIALILTLDNSIPRIKNIIGGFPQIIKNGISYVDEGFKIENGPSHTYERHPRTAVGFSSDKTKLYLVTVDGRQDKSIGITLPELADFMLSVDIHEAINLDGGGSTTLVANHKMINSPSDYSGERNVANALTIVSKAPKGSLNSIQIHPKQLKIKFGSQQAITLNAYDEYNTIFDIDTLKLSWTVSKGLGTLDKNNIFQATGNISGGYIKASYLDKQDSIWVTLVSVDKMELSPAKIKTDSIIPVKIITTSQNLNTTNYTIDPELLEWTVENNSVGTISSKGVFKGLNKGTTKVFATLGQVKASCEITVEIFSETMLLDNMEDPESWSLSSSFLDSTNLFLSWDLFTEGSAGLAIFYDFIYNNRTPYFTLHKTIPIKGIPDSIWIDSKFNGEQYRISYNLSTETNFNNLTYSEFVNHTSFKAVGNKLINHDLLAYPYMHKELKIEIWKNDNWIVGQHYNGTVYLDNLRVSYPGHASITTNIIPYNPYPDKDFFLYPNPVILGSNVFLKLREKCSLISLDIFDIKGQKLTNYKISSNHNNEDTFELNPNELQKGIYIIQLTTKNESSAHKLIIK